MEDNQRFIERCKLLGLTTLQREYTAFIKKAEADNMGFYQFIEHVVEIEAHAKKQRSIAYRIQKSRLPAPLKLIADFDFTFQPSLSKTTIMDLATMNFMKHQESILFIGTCGTGKSHLAQSLALIACQKGCRVLYTTCDLLLIDEMGHDRLELEVTKEAHLLFKVIDERYQQRAPLIFTTNVEEQDWADFLGDPISTKAILDRIFHHAVKVEINGPSYREYEGKLLQQKYDGNTADD